MRAIQYFARNFNGGVIAKSLPHKLQIVVNRLGHAHNSDRPAAAGYFFSDGPRTFLCAVTADANQDVNLPFAKEFHHFIDVLLAA